jgi:ferredoxin
MACVQYSTCASCHAPVLIRHVTVTVSTGAELAGRRVKLDENHVILSCEADLNSAAVKKYVKEG